MSSLRITLLSLVLACAAARVESAENLTIGSLAPPIDIEHWLNDKQPITAFEEGKVYVVEFWATWCGPCIASIPHLRDLQKRHGEALTVISVSDESLDAIETFLDREHDGTTMREMTGHYWLATDPDGSVKKEYMQAADQHGIPTAFLIGKTGLIEWIGHPMRIDEPVAQVLADKWDRLAYARQIEEERELRRKLRVVFEKSKQNQHEQALTMIDELMASSTSPQARQALEMARRRVQAAANGGSNSLERGGDSGPIRRVEISRLEIGDQVTIRVTGRREGSVWGDSIYTLDSDLGAAAVHAGLLQVGETKQIKLWVVPPPPSFGEANKNGIQSRKWGSFRAAIIMRAASPSTASAGLSSRRRENLALLEDLAVGESKTITITGTDRGSLWGTDTYTGDSRFEVAAVHAGVLAVGQQGEVIVTRVPPLNRYEGSERNGVRSGEWGNYPTAYAIKSGERPTP